MKMPSIEKIKRPVALMCAFVITMTSVVFTVGEKKVNAASGYKIYKPGETFNLPNDQKPIIISMMEYGADDRLIYPPAPNKSSELFGKEQDPNYEHYMNNTGITIGYDNGYWTYIDEYTNIATSNNNIAFEEYKCVGVPTAQLTTTDLETDIWEEEEKNIENFVNDYNNKLEEDASNSGTTVNENEKKNKEEEMQKNKKIFVDHISRLSIAPGYELDLKGFDDYTKNENAYTRVMGPIYLAGRSINEYLQMKTGEIKIDEEYYLCTVMNKLEDNIWTKNINYNYWEKLPMYEYNYTTGQQNINIIKTKLTQKHYNQLIGIAKALYGKERYDTDDYKDEYDEYIPNKKHFVSMADFHNKKYILYDREREPEAYYSGVHAGEYYKQNVKIFNASKMIVKKIHIKEGVYLLHGNYNVLSVDGDKSAFMFIPLTSEIDEDIQKNYLENTDWLNAYNINSMIIVGDATVKVQFENYTGLYQSYLVFGKADKADHIPNYKFTLVRGVKDQITVVSDIWADTKKDLQTKDGKVMKGGDRDYGAEILDWFLAGPLGIVSAVKHIKTLVKSSSGSYYKESGIAAINGIRIDRTPTRMTKNYADEKDDEGNGTWEYAYYYAKLDGVNDDDAIRNMTPSESIMLNWKKNVTKDDIGNYKRVVKRYNYPTKQAATVRAYVAMNNPVLDENGNMQYDPVPEGTGKYIISNNEYILAPDGKGNYQRRTERVEKYTDLTMGEVNNLIPNNEDFFNYVPKENGVELSIEVEPIYKIEIPYGVRVILLNKKNYEIDPIDLQNADTVATGNSDNEDEDNVLKYKIFDGAIESQNIETIGEMIRKDEVILTNASGGKLAITPSNIRLEKINGVKITKGDKTYDKVLRVKKVNIIDEKEVEDSSTKISSNEDYSQYGEVTINNSSSTRITDKDGNEMIVLYKNKNEKMNLTVRGANINNGIKAVSSIYNYESWKANSILIQPIETSKSTNFYSSIGSTLQFRAGDNKFKYDIDLSKLSNDNNPITEGVADIFPESISIRGNAFAKIYDKDNSDILLKTIAGPVENCLIHGQDFDNSKKALVDYLAESSDQKVVNIFNARIEKMIDSSSDNSQIPYTMKDLIIELVDEVRDELKEENKGNNAAADINTGENTPVSEAIRFMDSDDVATKANNIINKAEEKGLLGVNYNFYNEKWGKSKLFDAKGFGLDKEGLTEIEQNLILEHIKKFEDSLKKIVFEKYITDYVAINKHKGELYWGVDKIVEFPTTEFYLYNYSEKYKDANRQPLYNSVEEYLAAYNDSIVKRNELLSESVIEFFCGKESSSSTKKDDKNNDVTTYNNYIYVDDEKTGELNSEIVEFLSNSCGITISNSGSVYKTIKNDLESVILPLTVAENTKYYIGRINESNNKNITDKTHIKHKVEDYTVYDMNNLSQNTINYVNGNAYISGFNYHYDKSKIDVDKIKESIAKELKEQLPKAGSINLYGGEYQTSQGIINGNDIINKYETWDNLEVKMFKTTQRNSKGIIQEDNDGVVFYKYNDYNSQIKNNTNLTYAEKIGNDIWTRYSLKKFQKNEDTTSAKEDGVLAKYTIDLYDSKGELTDDAVKKEVEWDDVNSIKIAGSLRGEYRIGIKGEVESGTTTTAFSIDNSKSIKNLKEAIGAGTNSKVKIKSISLIKLERKALEMLIDSSDVMNGSYIEIPIEEVKQITAIDKSVNESHKKTINEQLVKSVNNTTEIQEEKKLVYMVDINDVLDKISQKIRGNNENILKEYARLEYLYDYDASDSTVEDLAGIKITKNIGKFGTDVKKKNETIIDKNKVENRTETYTEIDPSIAEVARELDVKFNLEELPDEETFEISKQYNFTEGCRNVIITDHGYLGEKCYSIKTATDSTKTVKVTVEYNEVQKSGIATVSNDNPTKYSIDNNVIKLSNGDATQVTADGELEMIFDYPENATELIISGSLMEIEGNKENATGKPYEIKIALDSLQTVLTQIPSQPSSGKEITVRRRNQNTGAYENEKVQLDKSGIKIVGDNTYPQIVGETNGLFDLKVTYDKVNNWAKATAELATSHNGDKTYTTAEGTYSYIKKTEKNKDSTDYEVNYIEFTSNDGKKYRYSLSTGYSDYYPLTRTDKNVVMTVSYDNGKGIVRVNPVDGYMITESNISFKDCIQPRILKSESSDTQVSFEFPQKGGQIIAKGKVAKTANETNVTEFEITAKLPSELITLNGGTLEAGSNFKLPQDGGTLIGIIALDIEEWKDVQKESIETETVEGEEGEEPKTIQVKKTETVKEWVRVIQARPYKMTICLPELNSISMFTKVNNIVASREYENEMEVPALLYKRALVLEKEKGDNLTKQENTKVTASSEDTTHLAKNIIDGSTNTQWKNNNNNVDLDKSYRKEWVQIEFEKETEINRADITWGDAYAKDYTISVSTDGENYVRVAEVAGNTKKERSYEFTPQSVKYVKIECTNNATSEGYSIKEVELYKTTQKDATSYSSLVQITSPTDPDIQDTTVEKKVYIPALVNDLNTSENKVGFVLEQLGMGAKLEGGVLRIYYK